MPSARTAPITMRTDVAITYSASAFFTVDCFMVAYFRACGSPGSKGLAGRPLPEARGIILWLTRDVMAERERKADLFLSDLSKAPGQLAFWPGALFVTTQTAGIILLQAPFQLPRSARS
jgi:hypothetical protein